jgi:hypothetical protein
MEFKQIVPEKLYAKISDFFESKDKSDFSISQKSESSTLVEYESKVNWDKLKNTWLVHVIIDQAQFTNKVDFSKIDVRSSADLIAKRPDLAVKFNLSSFNTIENSQYWFKILEKQPQFARSCDWSLINDYQKTKLMQIHPNINTNN